MDKPGLHILHAESEILSHQGLSSIAKKGGGIASLELAIDSKALFQCLKKKKFDLLIMDYQQPGFFLFTDLLKVRRKYPEQKILVISADNKSESLGEVLESGVEGYLTRQCDEDEIITAIFSIHNGEKFYCNKIINILIERATLPDKDANCSPTSLTDREVEITRLIAEGLTTKKIAGQLFLSEHTVSTHRKNILKKLDVSSVSEVIKYALNSGILSE
ncbi:MAG: response regulator transcription factor [Flavobacteriales bacterium]|nr:response regulator transcription factor [Flavobacteriales bacterium]